MKVESKQQMYKKSLSSYYNLVAILTENLVVDTDRPLEMVLLLCHGDSSSGVLASWAKLLQFSLPVKNTRHSDSIAGFCSWST